MAIGTPIEGTSIVIKAAPNTGTDTAPTIGTLVEVGNLTSISKNASRNKTTQTVFNRAAAYVSYDQIVATYTLQGLKSIADDGQDLLDGAVVSNDIIFLEVLWDGINGFSVPVRVGTKTGDSTPADRSQTSWELAAETSETLVGTGPVW